MRLPTTRLLLLCAPALTHELASDVAVTGSFAFMLGALETVVVEYAALCAQGGDAVEFDGLRDRLRELARPFSSNL